MTIIPERDVYRLIMRSKLPAAEAFEEWVVGTILPALRKDGVYVTGEEKVTAGEMDDDELALLAMERLRAKIDRLKEQKKRLETVITQVTPKAEVFDETFGSKLTSLTTYARKLTGTNINAIKGDLIRLGYCYRQGSSGTTRLYRRAPVLKLFAEKFNESNNKSDLFVTKEGAVRLVQHYRAGDLTMKKGCVPNQSVTS